MFKIAIVEDEVSCVEVLKKHILQYGEEYKITFQIQTFKNAIVFLENYKPEYDIIFMDIKISKAVQESFSYTLKTPVLD